MPLLAALSGLFTVMSELPPLRPLLFKFGLKAVNNLDNAAKGAAPTVNSWPLSPSVARNQFNVLHGLDGMPISTAQASGRKGTTY